jgi:hypothetical protein
MQKCKMPSTFNEMRIVFCFCFFFIFYFLLQKIYISHGMARTNKNKNICRAQNMHVYPVRCVVLNSSVCTVIHYGQGSVPHQHFVRVRVPGYSTVRLYGGGRIPYGGSRSLERRGTKGEEKRICNF